VCSEVRVKKFAEIMFGSFIGGNFFSLCLFVLNLLILGTQEGVRILNYERRQEESLMGNIGEITTLDHFKV
jgi:hypothetical protein